MEWKERADWTEQGTAWNELALLEQNVSCQPYSNMRFLFSDIP